MRPSAHPHVLDYAGGVDQSQVRETLRKISKLPAGDRVVLFSEQSEMIPDREQPLEQFLRFRHSPLEGVIVGQPEAAGQERALVTREAVDSEFRGISSNETAAQELLFNCAHCRYHARITGWQEADERNRQHAGIERV